MEAKKLKELIEAQMEYETMCRVVLGGDELKLLNKNLIDRFLEAKRKVEDLFIVNCINDEINKIVKEFNELV